MTSIRFRCRRTAVVLAALLYGWGVALLSTSNAIPVHELLPEFSGPAHDASTSFPLPPITVGAFNTIPTGNWLVSGTISGRWGNSISSSSAGVNVYLGDGGATSNDVLVATCVKNDACWLAQQQAWSHELTSIDLATLSAFQGPLVVSEVQTSETFVRLSQIRLDGETVPEPIPLILAGIGFGLLPLLPIARHRR